MIRRLLGRMGLSGYVPGSNDFGMDSRSADAPDAPLGEAHITFLGGAKTPYSPEEEAARKELGDDLEADLVWPGKPTTIGMRNDEPLAYRYNLTITNLPADHYIVLPPTGGARQPEGGVLLQPGEETIFEVRFPPIAREHLPPQSFHFVLTRFDPRRRNDPGVVVGEDAARWVPLPSANDFALRTDAGELRLRPWRRNAKFLLSLDDRCFLPSAANLHILRAPTRQALTEHAEQVETISQSLEARTSGKWSCELPPSQMRTSCWVSVRGAVRVGEHQTVPVALPKPIYVRYVPWLRMGRDWAFLGASLFSLMWLVWGIPVRRAPVVNMSVQFAGLDKGDLPAKNGKGNWDDLNFQIVSIEGTQLPKPIHGDPRGTIIVFEDLPKRWYGYRWPFNWWSGRAPQTYKVAVSIDPERSFVYEDYKLTKLKADKESSAKTSDPAQFAITVNDRHFMGEWTLKPTAIIPIAKAVRLNVTIDGNPLLKQAKEVSVVWEAGGNTKQEARPVLPYEKQVVLDEITTDILKPTMLKLYAVVDKNRSESQIMKVELREKPYNVRLTFPPPATVHPAKGNYKPGESVSISGDGLGENGEVSIGGQGLAVKPVWSSKGVIFTIPPGMAHGQADIFLKPENGKQIPAGTITILEATPAGTALSHAPAITVPKTPDSKILPKSNETGTGSVGSNLPSSGNVDAPTINKPGFTSTIPDALPTGKDIQAVPTRNRTNLIPSNLVRNLSKGGHSGSDWRQGGSLSTTSSVSALTDFSAYELYCMDDDKALSATEAVLRGNASADAQAGAHAIRGVILLEQGNQSDAETDITTAIRLAQSLPHGHASGRALALWAQARLNWKRNTVSREQLMQQFTEANNADPKMVLAWSDKAKYWSSNGYDAQANSVYHFGLLDNSNSVLYDYRFARIFHDRDKTLKAQQEIQNKLQSEKNINRRRVLNDLLGRLNDS